MKFKTSSYRQRRSVLTENNGPKTPFIWSLEKLTVSQIPLRRGAYKSKSTSYLVISSARYAGITLCLLVFTLSCAMLVSYIADYFKAIEEKNYYLEIFNGENNAIVSIASKSQSNVPTLSLDRSLSGESIDVEYNQTVYNEEFEQMRVKILAVKRQNPDIWGWITIENTNIDFPIMFSGDNEYYLTRTPDGKTNKNGSIFADGRTEEHLEDNKNLIIYGHNMSSTESMFAQVVEFTRENVFKNRLITVATLDGIYTYEVFSIYSTLPSYNYIRTYFSSNQDFMTFIKACNKKSLYSKDITITESDTILTLSTCTNQRDNHRWAVHAKLIGVSK